MLWITERTTPINVALTYNDNTMMMKMMMLMVMIRFSPMILLLILLLPPPPPPPPLLLLLPLLLRVSIFLYLPRGAGAHPFPLVPSLPRLLLLFTFFVGFNYFLLLSIPFLSIRIVPLRFQARGRRKRPNLSLVCCVYFVLFVLSVFLS